MTAYSERKDFALGDFVYVLIPLGDYTGKKTILEKVVQVSDVVLDVRPFEKFAPVTENFNNYYGSSLDEHSFIINKDYEKILFQKNFNDPYKMLGYNRLGLKLSVFANLKTMTQQVSSGVYRIFIELTGVDLTKQNNLDYTKAEPKTFYFDMEDMIFINPYYTSGYCNQEKVFNIENFALSSIKITVKQTEDFLDQNKEIINSDNFFIKFKNLYCSLGYECSSADIETEKLYAFPIDGLRYSSAISTKKVDVRKIKFYRDEKTSMPYGRLIFLEDGNGWGRYSPESSIVDNNFNIPGFELLPGTGERKEDGYFEIPLNINKGLSQNRFIFSVGSVQKALSTEILFTNSDYIKNAELLDNIIGFTGKLADGRESFNVYGLDNKLINDFEENHIFYLIISYNSVNGRTIMPTDTLTWSFPTENTMLIPYPDTGATSFTMQAQEGDYRDGSFWIPFKIKNIYNQNYINNTISCSLSFRDDSGYEQKMSFSKTLLFGFSGSEGSKYIYNLELYKTVNGEKKKIQFIHNGETNFDNYHLELKIFDYNMKPIDNIENIVKYKWIYENDNNFTDYESFDLSAPFSSNIPAQDRIIVAKSIMYEYQIETNRGVETREKASYSYLPIGTIIDNASKDNNFLLEGCKTIVYDTLGIKPYYYKGAYTLYKDSALLKTGITYEVHTSLPENLKPQLREDKIIPYYAYIEDFTHFSIQIFENKNLILEFPVVVMQSQYSATTEYENDPMFIAQNDELKKILLGYVSSNQDGILIGKLSNKENIGLYSYLNGEDFFTLDKQSGLLVNGPVPVEDEDYKINFYNGNLYNFRLYNCSGSIDSAEMALSAKKLIKDNGSDLSVGSNTVPVYFSNGIPVTCSSVATTSQINSLSDQITALSNQITQMNSIIQGLQAQIEDLSK